MSDDINFGIEEDDNLHTSVSDGSGGVGVLRIAKRDYAIGLYWNTVNNAANAAKEAREMAVNEQIKADFYCTRGGTTPQFGLGFKSALHRAGMPSLAAHLATVKSGNWIGLFNVPGGLYLFGVRDDAIIAECDRFFSNREQAIDSFQFFQAQSEWGGQYAPEDLGVPGTSPLDLAPLLGSKPPARLIEVSRSKGIYRLALAALVVFGGLVGGYMYIDSINQEAIEAEMRLKWEQAQQVVAPKQEIQIPPMPWEGRPLAIAVLEACRGEVLKFRTDFPGWKLSELYCVDNTVAAALDRLGALGEGGGPVNWIEMTVARDGFKPSIDFPAEGSGQRVRVQWSTKELPKIPVDLQRIKIGPTVRAIQQVLEGRMTKVVFSDADSNDFWKGKNFKFSTRDDIARFGDLIAALPGVIIDRIRYDVANAEWQLEGKFYEQLDLPKQPVRR